MRILLALAVAGGVAASNASAADWLEPPLNPPAAANPFAGGYVALGGAYGLGGQRSANLSSNGPPGAFGFDNGLSVSGASAAGWSGVAAGGYNMTFGAILVGMELDGRLGDEKLSKDASAVNFSPFSPTAAGLIQYSYSSKSDAGVHLAARVGAISGNTLIFAKAGVGATRFKDGFAADQTGAQRCTLTGNSGAPLFQTICVASTNVVGGTGAHSSERWLPSFVVGVGAEQNFGSLFARGAVEAETVAQNTYTFTQPTANGWSFSGSSSTLNTQWTVRASLMAGLRF